MLHDSLSCRDHLTVLLFVVMLTRVSDKQMSLMKVSVDQTYSDRRLKVEDSSEGGTDGGESVPQLPVWTEANGIQPAPPITERRTIFFDLDNTLYSKALGIHNQMADRIQLFMREILLLPKEESRRLSAKYYLDYGLSVRGILADFQIETSDYDRFVDGGLDLEGLLKPDDQLRRWLQSLQASLWIFTNAGKSHADRVLKLLGISDLFKGIIFCDYNERRFPAKPERLAYERAMTLAGVRTPSLCYFIDDSANNVRVARELGWNAVHFDEENEMARYQHFDQHLFPRIRTVKEMTTVFPELLQPEAPKLRTLARGKINEI